MAQVHLLPNFRARAELSERQFVDEVSNTMLQFAANDIGADTVYVTKSKTGNYYPLTFMFYGKNSKHKCGFMKRMSQNTVANY